MDTKPALAQIRRLWGSLSVAQRISIAIAVVAVIAGLSAFSWWRNERDFQPLYSGMNLDDAGSVVARLRESNTEFRIANGGTSVLVPSHRVAETRLSLAAAGLPRSGRIGFELFDSTNLGTTDFAEQVNFRRALEGELERSIRSVADVEQARVHLTFARQSVFIESRLPAKASVLLRLREGGQLAPSHVTAITHLIASAVDGLSPAHVSVLDANGNLLSRPKSALDETEASDELIEYRRKLEKDLLAKAHSTLEPLVGAGRYRIGLSIDCDFSTGEQSDELYDPEKSVMLSSQKTEEANGTGSSGGIPGTASNLPRPAPRTGGAAPGVIRRTENVTYQSSRTVRRVRLPQGGIRRISASLLLDQASHWERQNGTLQQVLTPPGAESVRAIRELVSAALGLVPSRGDQLVIESLPFEATRQAPPPSAPKMPAPPRTPEPARRFALPAGDWRIWAGAGGATFLLVIAAGVFLRSRKRRLQRPTLEQNAAIGSRSAPSALPGGGGGALAAADAQAARVLSQAQEKVTQTARIETLVQELRSNVGEDPALAASVLRSWLEEANA